MNRTNQQPPCKSLIWSRCRLWYLAPSRCVLLDRGNTSGRTLVNGGQYVSAHSWTCDSQWKLKQGSACTSVCYLFVLACPRPPPLIWYAPSNWLWLKKEWREEEKKKKGKVSCFSSNTPMCLEWRQVTLGELSLAHPRGAKVLKTKHRLPAKKQIIFEGGKKKVWWKDRRQKERRILSKHCWWEEIQSGLTPEYIQNAAECCSFFKGGSLFFRMLSVRIALVTATVQSWQRWSYR